MRQAPPTVQSCRFRAPLSEERTMFIKFLYAFICAVTMVCGFLFVRSQYNGACGRSLTLKMIAATGYIAIGALAVKISGNESRFALIMFGALICSWIGDLFLHLWQHKIYTAIGFLGFLTAHFFFIAAYLRAIRLYAPDRSFFSAPEIIAVVLFDVFFLVFSRLIGTEIKGVLNIPIVMYATVITTMLCKACIMGISMIKVDVPHATAAAVLAVAGASLFVMSDFSIAILMFNKKYKKSHPLKMFNILTYFAAELALASLLLVVNPV